jgi:transcriptional regulator GlxA family with amidase domain
LQESHGRRAIRAVADELGISERHLERLFLERVGTRPKLFARVLRVQRAIALLESRREPAATLVAGFADEPHLVREFRALTGLTPRKLLRERHVGFVQPDARASL